MSYKFILGLDPSGNFYEGKGTTGWCIFNTSENKIIKAGSISAKDFKSQEEYWFAHIDLITDANKKYKKKLIVVMEDYMLYPNKAKSQVNSRMKHQNLLE